jgi:superfamily II helicase
VAITDRIDLANYDRVRSQLDANIPRRAFAGATLDVLWGAESDGLESLDDATRDRLLAFAREFLAGCDEGDLFGGVPERRFVQYLLDERAAGRSSAAIVTTMERDYGVTAYPGDIRSFLDQAVRTLEAAEEMARVEGRDETAARIAARREELL